MVILQDVIVPNLMITVVANVMNAITHYVLVYAWDYGIE